MDPGGLWQAVHPLSQTVGGPETLDTEDGGGPPGDGLPMRKGCPSNPDPLMACTLAVAYPELDGHLRASQQPQGASSGGGAEAPATEGAASHSNQEAVSTDDEGTSGTEGEGSTTEEAGGDSSNTDTSCDGSSLVVEDTSVTTPATGTATTLRISTSLPAAPQRVAGARSPRRMGISFVPGTSGPAPVSPAALSEEAIELLRSISVGQSTIVNAIQGLAAQMQQSNAFLEGTHTGLAAKQRLIQALASSLTAAIGPVRTVPAPTSTALSHTPQPKPIPSTLPDEHAHKTTPKSVTGILLELPAPQAWQARELGWGTRKDEAVF
ncbi:hypothetical protein NDU88_003829 [Pleurodeles waltl]|uniref:Uncharacterized protein n=1 Tax=Pleurodeles waltl TaxID=8319 RepID=A0AAV7LJJ7_PLEWA|nr:hypothetical protein NDU88_003829 [Pleurodeles waltl]